MKIGIYGDSYGACPSFDYTNYNYVGLAWWEILGKKYNISNYCAWGASLLYSTDLFLKTHSSYDKIIFLVTHPGRITIKNTNKDRHFINYEYSTLWKKRAKKENWEELLNAALLYYKYISNDNYNMINHFSYLEIIKSNRNDVKFIPCFENSFDKVNFCLHDICKKEEHYWKMDDNIGYMDIRKGHITEENHKILAKKIDDFLKTDILDLKISDFKNPSLNKEQFILQ